jgi:small nuclear ribonucleoprotein (snRNP)-like protein
MPRRGGLLGDIADATALLGTEGGGPLAALASWRQAGSRVCVSIRSTGKGRDALRYGRRPLRGLVCAWLLESVSIVLRWLWFGFCRGRLTGMLLTYDRHFNLVLGDVEEVYQRRLPAGEAIANQDSPLASSWASRRLHQLFVRGDSVIVVARVP